MPSRHRLSDWSHHATAADSRGDARMDDINEDGVEAEARAPASSKPGRGHISTRQGNRNSNSFILKSAIIRDKGSEPDPFQHHSQRPEGDGRGKRNSIAGHEVVTPLGR